MRALVHWLGNGEVQPVPCGVEMPFLNATFTFGSATIPWNSEAAARVKSAYKLPEYR